MIRHLVSWKLAEYQVNPYRWAWGTYIHSVMSEQATVDLEA